MQHLRQDRAGDFSTAGAPCAGSFRAGLVSRRQHADTPGMTVTVSDVTNDE
jgi:hypothetical protein